MEAKLLAADVSKQTHDSIMAQVEDRAKTLPAMPANQQRKPADPAHPPDPSMIAGLLLGSPEFQRK
jgi:hypothetical protein